MGLYTYTHLHNFICKYSSKLRLGGRGSACVLFFALTVCFFFRGESPLHILVHAKANLGGPNAVYQEEALARRQGSWCSVRHERSQEPVGSRRWGQQKVNVNATGRGPKLTARRLGGDKQRTGPGDVHPGLGIGRAARRLRNNRSGRHERN